MEESRNAAQHRAVDAARLSVRSETDAIASEAALRHLAYTFGAKRPITSTLNAIQAVLDQIEHPSEFARDQDVCDKHGVKKGTFADWKQKLAELLRSAAVDELSAQDEAELSAALQGREAQRESLDAAQRNGATPHANHLESVASDHAGSIDLLLAAKVDEVATELGEQGPAYDATPESTVTHTLRYHRPYNVSIPGSGLEVVTSAALQAALLQAVVCGAADSVAEKLARIGLDKPSSGLSSTADAAAVAPPRDVSENEPICRICLEGADLPSRPLVRPCACRGSSTWAHEVPSYYS